jgi:hypothetical protein
VITGADTFWVEGSPLEGRRVPMGWRSLDLPGKRAALVRAGLARDLRSAASLMGRHAAACRKYRAAIRGALRS